MESVNLLLIDMLVCNRIKNLKGKNNFTQSQLADKLGLTYIQIRRYEKGKSFAS